MGSHLVVNEAALSPLPEHTYTHVGMEVVSMLMPSIRLPQALIGQAHTLHMRCTVLESVTWQMGAYTHALICGRELQLVILLLSLSFTGCGS